MSGPITHREELRAGERLARDLRHSLALILAGGVGSRLNVLVRQRAKPAVPFGGIYRLIDFTLSNLINSGLERVGILTQYLPYSLTDHIGDGRHWGLVGRTREVRILPPHQGASGSDWYLGTADAIYRNLGYIHRHDPEFVLLLSGDHVYHMDYAPMIDAHVRAGADVTIAVRRVPMEQASDFGTVHVDRDSYIVGFEEKPAVPTSNLISMGIYVFSARVLVERLMRWTSTGAAPDFGHHIFPRMLSGGDRMFAYEWSGYWEDVGTLRAYFDSHMDLVRAEGALDLSAWRIRTNLDESRVGDRPPAWIARGAEEDRVLVSRGCRLEGTVTESILSPGVVIERGAHVHRSILMHDVRIGAGAKLEHAILDKQVEVGHDARIGFSDDGGRINERFPTHLDGGLTVIGKGARVPERARIGTNVCVFPGSVLRTLGRPTVASGETVGEDSA